MLLFLMQCSAPALALYAVAVGPVLLLLLLLLLLTRLALRCCCSLRWRCTMLAASGSWVRSYVPRRKARVRRRAVAFVCVGVLTRPSMAGL